MRFFRVSSESSEEVREKLFITKGFGHRHCGSYRSKPLMLKDHKGLDWRKVQRMDSQRSGKSGDTFKNPKETDVQVIQRHAEGDG